MSCWWCFPDQKHHYLANMQQKSENATASIKLNDEQIKVLTDALNVYVQLGLGRLEVIPKMMLNGDIALRHSSRASSDDIDEMTHVMNRAKRILGHSKDCGFAVGNPKLPVAVHCAYEILVVARKFLADRKNPNPSMRTVEQDGLNVRYTDYQAPEMTPVDCD